MSEFQIVGAGLAGCSLAWQLEARGADFVMLDRRSPGEASRVAAGLVNPVTGKNFEPSWRIQEFWPEAEAFYQMVESEGGRRLWFPMPVVRLVGERQWEKVARKLERDDVAPWVERIDEHVDGWRAAVVLKGGGRVDVKAFCEASLARFEDWVSKIEHPKSNAVRCGGAADLIAGQLGEHRCAKGEILTVRIAGGDESRILVGAGGWIVPVGDGLFRAGSTYEWDELDGRPTEAGRERVEEILMRLGVDDFEVVKHEAGVRPIVRRSKPLIGPLPGGDVVFNGLGSKGSLYAPGVARRLAHWLVDGTEIEEDLDAARWMDQGGAVL